MLRRCTPAPGCGRVLALLLAAGLFARPGSGQTADAGGEAPALVVMITIDQLRGDYFERFGEHLTGGLKRIREGSAFFPNGRQNHALTYTAPGHSTVLSGRYPASTGILSNDHGVPDPAHPLLGRSTATGASPRKFRGTTLYDWMRAADPEAKVVSVSRKDRGAILPVGRARGQVYWYSQGEFTTSTYYARELPDWVKAYNARFRPEDWAGREWTLLLPEDAYPEPDDMPYEGDGRGTKFPHRITEDLERVPLWMEGFPWMDSLTLDFALEAMRRERLGERGRPDLLAISLSTLDAIGHAFGPDSREVRDHIYRLDRWLGAFLDSLAARIPPDRMVLALAADHGVSPFPERLLMLNQGPAGRIRLGPIVRELRQSLESRFLVDFEIEQVQGLLLANVHELAARGVDVDSLSEAVAARIAEVEGVKRVFTRRSFAAAPADDIEAELWRRHVGPDVGWLALVVAEPGYIFNAGRSTTHGTTNWLDMNVPIAFMGPGIPAGTHTRPIDTVDIAPTLAALLGIQPTEPVNGRILPEIAPRAAALDGR